MALCVNTSSPLFKTLAEKYDLSNGRLEQLIHQYDRIAGTSQTTEALEKFIQDNLNGKENVVSAKAIESALALWNRDFSVPRVFASMKEAAAYAAQAERYFDPKAVITKETRAGNYEVRVNQPTSTFTKEKAAIKKRAIADGTFMKAPNGKPTNLTEDQWLTVRTQAFKAWFGDWENPTIFTANNVDNVEELKAKYPSALPNKFYHHSTNRYGKQAFDSREGTKERLHITGRLTTDKVDVLVVENPNSSNEVSHITLATAEGVKPVQSNTELANNKDKIVPLDDYVDTTFTNNLDRNVSKAVDENGEPLVVYHGSNENFNAFDANLGAIYTAEDRETAKSYQNATKDFIVKTLKSLAFNKYESAEETNVETYTFADSKYDTSESDYLYDLLEGTAYTKYLSTKSFWTSKDLLQLATKIENSDNGSLYPLFMNIKNPIIIEGNNANWRAITYKGSKYSTRDLEKMFKTSDYDGVVIKNINDVGGSASRNTPKYSNIRLVYKANQIKSATDNNGDFSTEDNNIYHEGERTGVNVYQDNALKGIYDGSASSENSKVEVSARQLTDLIPSTSPMQDVLRFLAAKKDRDGALLDGTKVILAPHYLSGMAERYNGRRAFYDSSERTVYVDPYANYSYGSADTVIMHELLHAVTVGKIRSSKELMDEADDIIRIYLKKHFNSRYDKSRNPDTYVEEFIADVWSNPTTIVDLKNISYPGKLSLWDKVKQWFSSALSGIFKGQNTLFERASQLVFATLDNARVESTGIFREGNTANVSISQGYHKGDPQRNPSVNYVFTENAEAYLASRGRATDGISPFRGSVKLNVSDVNGTNQAGIRTDSKGNLSPNAFGVVVKKFQHNSNGGFVAKEGQFQDTESDFELFKTLNNEMFDALKASTNTSIVFPHQMALGKAALPLRFAEWLRDKLGEFGVSSTITENTRSDYEGYGLSIDSISNSSKPTSLDINYSKGNNQILSNFATRIFSVGDKAVANIGAILSANGVDSGVAEWLKGFRYNSVEMAFQYAKTYFSSAMTNLEACELHQRMADSSPYEIKNLGRTIPLSESEVKEWNKAKSGIMKALIKESMLQDEDARINLLATAGKELTHSVPGEWQTEFPRILMEVRDELLKEEAGSEVANIAEKISEDLISEDSNAVSKEHQAYQEKSLAQQNKLRNLQKSLTETEINEASNEVMWTIMDKLDAYFADPEQMYDDFKSAFGYELPVRKDDEEIREMSRADLIEMIGTDNFLNIVRKSLYEWNEAVDDMSPEDFDKTAILNENFDAVLVKVIKNISKFEDFVIPYNLNENTFGKLQENTSEVTLGEDETIENDSESENREVDENNVEGYFIDKKTQSIWTTTTRMVRRVIQNLYEYDAEGNPVTTVRGVVKRMNPLIATQTIEKLVSGSMNVTEMIARLKDHFSMYPAVGAIIEKLESNKAEDTQFQSQFFNAFDRHRMEFSGVVENSDGSLSSKTFNVHTAKSNVIKSVKGMIRSGSTVVFGSGGFVTKEGLAAFIKDVNTAFNGKFAEISKSPQLFEDRAAAIAQVMLDLGFEVPVGDVVKILDSKSYTKMQNAARGIAENLGKVVNNKTYEPFKVSKDNTNGIYGYFSSLVTPVTDIWEDTQIASFYDHGKMYQSYLLPSWMSKLAIKFHSEPDRFKDYIDKEYGRYEWFRRQDGDSELPSSYRNYILQMLVANASNPEQRDKIFKHKTQLSFKGRQYMRDLGFQDYAVSMLTEFASMLNNGKTMQFGYYPIPIESNKPSAEYLSLPVFLGDNFKDKITQYLVDTFIQEVMRIRTVKKRKSLDPNSPLKIKDFDKRGDKFCILTWFNDYLEGDASTLDAEGLELKGYLEELVSIDADKNISDEDVTSDSRRSTLIQNAIKRAIDTEVAITRSEWANQGIEAAVVHMENAGKFTDDNGRFDFNALVEAYVWNYALASSGILEIAITDPAFYPNYEQLQKRLGQLHSPGSRPNIEAKDYVTGKPVSDGIHRHIVFADDELEKAGKLFASNTIDNLKFVFDKAIANEKNPLKKERLKEMKEDAVKAYSGMDFTNAQAYSSPTSYRKKAHMFGKWSAKHQALYEKITGIRYNSDNSYTRNPELAEDASFEDLEFIFQPLKPFLYSTTTVSSGVNSEMGDIKTNIQVKDAEYLLTVVGMFNEATYSSKAQTEGKPNLLRAIYEVMEESADSNPARGLDTVVFDSTTKTGLHAALDISQFYDDPKGEEKLKSYLRSKIYQLDSNKNPILTSYNPAIVQESMYEDYSMQQELQDHVRDHMQIHSSQLRYNAISGLEMYDSEGKPYTIKYYDGETLVETTLAEAIQDYESTIAQSIYQSMADVEKEFSIGAHYVSETDRKIALSIALQEQIMSDSRYGVDLLEACQINENGEFNVAPGEDVQSSRIEQMVNSIVKNRVNKFKLFGGPAVQITNFGMSTELNMRYYDKKGNILKTKKEFLRDSELTEMYSSDYAAYVADNQDRFAYAEILAPITSDILRVFGDKNGNVDISLIEELCPRLLNVSLLRTPNENRYSSLPAKIVGFLPKASGTTVAGPYDITRQMGCDFDWDKLTMILENVNIKELDEFELAEVRNKINEKYSLKLYDVKKQWEAKYDNSDSDKRDEQLAEKYKAKAYAIQNRRKKLLESPALRYKVSYPTSGQAYRANKIASLTHALLSHESATTQLVKPGGFDNLKKVGYMVAAFKNPANTHTWDELRTMTTDELKKLAIVGMNLVFPRTQQEFYKRNKVAGNILGIFAVQKVAHAILQNLGIKVSSTRNFFIGDFEVKEWNNLDNMYDSSFRLIGDALSENVSGSVDAVKDPILNFMNVDETTAGMLCAMLRIGMDLETIATFVSQECVIAAMDEVSRRVLAGKPSSFLGYITKQLERPMYAEYLKSEDSRIYNIETKELIDGMLSTPSAHHRFKILAALKELSDMANAIRPVDAITRNNAIASAAGPLVIDNLIQSNLEEALNQGTLEGRIGIDVGKYDKNGNPEYSTAAYRISNHIYSSHPILNAFRQGRNLANQLLKDIPTARLRFKDLVSVENGKFGEIISRNRDLMQKFARFYKSFVAMASGVIPSKVRNLDALSYFAYQYPKDFLALKKKHAGNKFVDAIKPAEEKGYVVLNIDTTGLDDTSRNELSNAWADLYKKDEEFAMNLFYYAFFRGGIGFSPKSFMKLLPTYMKERIEGYNEAFSSDSAVIDTEALMDQFALNYYDEYSLVKTSYKEDALGDILECSKNGNDYYGIAKSFPHADDLYVKVRIGKTYIVLKNLGGVENYNAIDASNPEFKMNRYRILGKVLGNEHTFVELDAKQANVKTISPETPIVAPAQPELTPIDGVPTTDGDIKSVAIKKAEMILPKENRDRLKEMLRQSNNERALNPDRTRGFDAWVIEQARKNGVKINKEELDEIRSEYCIFRAN